MTQLPGNTLIDSAAFAAIVSYLLSLFKPLIEALPWATPNSRLHDTTIRVFNLLLNELMVLAAYAVSGPLQAQSIWLYGFQGLAQAIASDHLYSVITSSSGSVALLASTPPGEPPAVPVEPPAPVPPGGPSNEVEGQTLQLTLDPHTQTYLNTNVAMTAAGTSLRQPIYVTQS